MGGLGVEVVLVQGGRVTAGAGYELPLAGLATGIAMAFIDLNERQRHVLRYLVAVGSVLVLLGGITQPATALQTGCDVSIVIDGDDERVPFSRDSGNPTFLDLGAMSTLAVVSEVAPEAAIVEVTLASVQPFGFTVDPDEVVLYYGEPASASGAGTVTVTKEGATGYTVGNADFESTIIPFGLVELHVTIRDTSQAGAPVLCEDTYWIRVVSTPVASPIGLVAIAGGIAGLAGIAWVAGTSAFVPPGVQRHRFVERSGGECETLEAGSTYRLEIELNLGLGLDDEEKKKAEIELSSDTIEIIPSISIGIGPLPLSVEITPSTKGDHGIDVTVKLSGKLIGLSTISVSVVEAEFEDIDPGPEITLDLTDRDREATS